MTKTDLQPLQKNLFWFSLVNYRNQKIMMTGGRNDAGVTSRETHFFNLETGHWEEQKEPDLNQGRIDHGSCIIGYKVYVVCGYDYKKGYLDSIEVLDMALERKIDILGVKQGR